MPYWRNAGMKPGIEDSARCYASAAWPSIGNRSCLNVADYESLVTEPWSTTDRVMKFCSVPFEPDCIDITSTRVDRQQLASQAADTYR